MTNRFLLLGKKGPSSQKAKKLPRHSAISLLPVIRCKRARARNSFSRLGSHRECPNQDSLRDRYQIYVLSKFQTFPRQFQFLAIFQSSASEAVWSARAPNSNFSASVPSRILERKPIKRRKMELSVGTNSKLCVEKKINFFPNSSKMRRCRNRLMESSPFNDIRLFSQP